MSEAIRATNPTSAVADVRTPTVNVPPIGPIESRRARRERHEAALFAESLRERPSPFDDLDDDDEDGFSERRPTPTSVVFSDEVPVDAEDELAVARERKHHEAMPRQSMSYQDWVN